MTCERFREAVMALDDPGTIRRREEGAHLEGCADCRGWMDRLAEGLDDWAAVGGDLTASVMARTTRGACDRARVLMAGAADGELAGDEAALLAGHVERCPDCRSFGSELARAMASLPILADGDPGLGFVEAVLARTSRRPAAATWADRARSVWQSVIRRPRIAWEAAYVCTLCWLLVFGQPVAALHWTTARVSASARSEVSLPLVEARGHAKAMTAELFDGAARAASRVVEAGRSRAEQAARSWQERALAWAQREVAVFAHDMAASWHALVAWLTGTEPAPTPVRSSQ